jgi:DNA-binding response OmpR family regulator
VKEIIESHKGSLTYDSVLGQGTTFQVFMDSYVANKVDNSIVIVEDDENLAKLITVSFEKLQLPTVHMKTAEAAIFSLNQSSARPLLCIVDIQLDGQKSGWDFVTELLKRPLYENTPIIVSTVLEQPKHFHETDTEKFLKKPFSVERLLELAEQLIAQGKERGAVVFPMQNEQSLATSLEQMGIHVKEMKMKKDIIEVEVNNDERGS